MLATVDCPYCGETFETAVDDSAGDQDYIEDCPVCCRPIEYHLKTGPGDGSTSITARRDDD